MNRGSYGGVPINAKPLYLLAIFDGIKEGKIIGNKLQLAKALEESYLQVCQNYEPTKTPAPFFKPFFHLKSESFYFIKWKDGKDIQNAGKTPSAKYLRENVEYAALDDQLWDMLQDTEIREDFKMSIINRYLK